VPTPSSSAFAHDPEIKRKVIFSGPYYSPASSLVEQKANLIKIREDRQWQVVSQQVPVLCKRHCPGDHPGGHRGKG
jgi:predicted ATPase